MDDNKHIITSPVMGIFYKTSAPGEDPFVKEGQKIKASDLVCMIESMKIFTELRSGHSGTITKFLVENEEPVMKNQALIEIKKD